MKPNNLKNCASDAEATAQTLRAWSLETWLGLAVAAWLVGCFVQLIYRLRFATPLLTDDLIYHLAIPANWIRNGWIAPFTAWFHEAAPGYSPMLVERLAWLLMLPAHNEVWARWVQLPFQFGIAILTYRVLRAMRVEAVPAGLTAAATLILKPYLGESLSCHNDLALTFFFLLAVWGGLVAWNEKFSRGIARFLCGIFLMLGTKYVGLAYSGVLLILFMALYLTTAFKNDSADPPRRSRWMHISRFVIIIFALIVGLHTYVYNWSRTGNPIFPAEVRIMGAPVFDGLYTAAEVRDYETSIRSLFNLMLDPHEAYTLSTVTGSVAVAASLLNLLLWAARARLHAGLFLTGTLPWILWIAYFVLIPFGEPRLAFPIYALLWMAPAAAVTYLRGETLLRWPVASGVIAVLAVSACIEFNQPIHMFTPLTIGAALLAPFVLRVLPRLKGFCTTRLLVYPSLLLMVALGLIIYVYAEPYAMRYDKQRRFEHGYGDLGRAWTWLDEQTRDHPAVIAFAGTSMRYPLYGQRLQNDVRYVHIHYENFDTFDGYLERRMPLLTFTSAISWCNALFRSIQDKLHWKEQLFAQRVDFVFLVRLSESGQLPIEADWVASDPRFQRVIDSADVVIYSVTRENLQ